MQIIDIIVKSPFIIIFFANDNHIVIAASILYMLLIIKIYMLLSWFVVCVIMS